MSISSVGKGPISPAGTKTQVQGGRSESKQTEHGHHNIDGSKLPGAQPLNSSGRGQIINLLV